MPKNLWPIILLVISNIFMTFAWYGHLKHKNSPIVVAILLSWGVAFFEYCFQVPANRIGAQNGYQLGQLKVVQEVITMSVFMVFAYLYMHEKMGMNYLYASLCLVGAAYFMFRGA